MKKTTPTTSRALASHRPPRARSSRLKLAVLALVAGALPLAGLAQSYLFRAPVPQLEVQAPGGAAVQTSTAAVNFGNVATNTTETRQVVLSNVGTATLGVTAAPEVQGDATFGAGLTSCASSLTAGASCTTEVEFSPTLVGASTGALHFSTSLAGLPADVSLAGTAYNPVSLTAATLPTAKLNRAYTPYNFASLLAVSNEASPTLAEVSWAATGTPPTGMSFDAGTATLSGTPTALTAPEGSSFTVLATYKSNQGQQVYTIKVGEAVLEAVQVSAGSFHTCAVTAAGGVKCWGRDDYGQLGDGAALTNKPTPVDVVGLPSGVVSVSAGYGHTCAVTTTGGLKCWGYDQAGQLGNDAALVDQPTPVNVYGLTSGVASVSAGALHTCVLTVQGRLKCWGNDAFGQLGNDTVLSDQPTPVDVQGLTSGVASVSAGFNHTCTLTTAGGVKCWGRADFGQLGDGTTTARPIPVDVQGLTSGIASLEAGGYHTCVVTTAGGAKCWGNDGDGELGNDAMKVNQSTPVDVQGLASGIASLAAGVYHTCAVTTAGSLKCWGDDGHGQLGNDAALVSQPTPVNVAGLSAGVASASAGQAHTCAVTTAGGLKCWGYDQFGGLGDDVSLARQPTPVNVAE